MAKDNVTQYSTTASSNTDIGGVNIDESCPPSGINNAIRELMKQTADWVSGSQAITALTVTGEVDAGSLDVSGQIDVDGVSYLDAVVVDGTVTVGVDDTGHDVKFYGDTASAYMQWDASSDDLILGGAAGLTVAGSAALNATTVTTLTASGAVSITGPSLVIGDNNASSNGYDSLLHLLGDGSSGYRFGVDSGNTELSLEREYNGWLDVFTVTRATGTTNFNSPINVGVDDTGHDVKFHGATSGRYMEWDESQDVLRLSDNVQLQFGGGSDLRLTHDGSNSYIIDQGTGGLYIQGDTFAHIGSPSGETGLAYTKDGAVDLYHDNVKKLATTSGGVEVTGVMDADNFKVNGAQGSDGQVLTSTGSGVAWEAAGGGGGATYDILYAGTSPSNDAYVDCDGYGYVKVIVVNDGGSSTSVMGGMYTNTSGGTASTSQGIYLRIHNDGTTTATAYNPDSGLGYLGDNWGDDDFIATAEWFGLGGSTQVCINTLRSGSLTTMLGQWVGKTSSSSLRYFKPNASFATMYIIGVK